MALTGSSAYKTSLSALILYLLLPQWDPVSWNWRPPTTVPQFYSCCCLPPSHSLLHLCNGSQVFASTAPGSQPYSLHPSHHGPCVKKTPLGGLLFFSRLAVFFPFLNSQSTSISFSLITCVTDCVIFSTYLLPSQPCPTLRLLPGHTGIGRGQSLPQPHKTWEGVTCCFSASSSEELHVGWPCSQRVPGGAAPSAWFQECQ